MTGKPSRNSTTPWPGFNDAENRIKKIDNGVVDFAYDSEGRQIRRTFLGTSTYYLYGLTGLISEFTTTNTGASQASATDRLRYRLAEQTGTAVLFVSPSGSLVESNRVYPYGEKWMADYGTGNDQKFTTYTRQDDHYTDEVDYAMMRYYFYSHAAFMSPDISGANIDLANPQSWNAYAYVNGDPIDFTYSSGEGLFSLLVKSAGSVGTLFNQTLGAC